MISIYQLNRTVSLIKKISNKSLESEAKSESLKEPIIEDSEIQISHSIEPTPLKSPIRETDESEKIEPSSAKSNDIKKIDSNNKPHMKCIKPKYTIIKTAYANHYLPYASDSRRSKLYPFPQNPSIQHQRCTAIPNIPHTPVPTLYPNKPIHSQPVLYPPMIPPMYSNPYIPTEPIQMPIKYYPYKANPVFTAKRPRIAYNPKANKYPPAMIIPPRNMDSNVSLFLHKTLKNNYTTHHNPMMYRTHNTDRCIKHMPILYNAYNQEQMKVYHSGH